MWLVVLIIAIVVGAIIGALSSNDKEKGEGATVGAITAGMGCGYVMIQILVFVFILFIIFKLFGFLFG